MTYHNLIFGIGILIGLLMFKRTKPVLLKILIIGFAVCYIMPMFRSQITINIGFFGFGFLTMIFIVWSLLKSYWIGVLTSFFALTVLMWRILHWEFLWEIRFLLIIPILWYVYLLIKKKTEKNEFSVLTIITAFNLTEFLTLIERWI